MALPKDLLGLFQATLTQRLQEEDAQSSTRLSCVPISSKGHKMPHPNQMSPGKGVFHKYIKHFLSAFFGEKKPQILSGIFKVFCLKFGEALKDRKRGTDGWEGKASQEHPE